MTDKADIQDLMSRYSDAVTRRDWEAVAAVFLPDATWRIVGSDTWNFAGDKICPGIRNLVEQLNYLLQLNTPALIEVTGDTASARSTILEKGEYDPGKFKEYKARFDAFGFYEDVIRKVNGKWLFASRRYTLLNMSTARVEE